MSGLLEIIIVLIIGGVIYQMFFTTKDLKKYNPNENVAPEYDKEDRKSVV